MNNTYKDIRGYEGIYQVSDQGNVRSLNYKRTGKPANLTLTVNDYSKGVDYQYARLYKNGKPKLMRVDILVAEAYLPRERGKNHIVNLNLDTTDNRAQNLKRVSQDEYSQHQHQLQLHRINSWDHRRNIRVKERELEERLDYVLMRDEQCRASRYNTLRL